MGFTAPHRRRCAALSNFKDLQATAANRRRTAAKNRRTNDFNGLQMTAANRRITNFRLI
jgi:hypothetical protein